MDEIYPHSLACMTVGP